MPKMAKGNDDKNNESNNKGQTSLTNFFGVAVASKKASSSPAAADSRGKNKSSNNKGNDVNDDDIMNHDVIEISSSSSSSSPTAAAAAAVASAANKKKYKMSPKYHLKLTKVKHRVVKNNDDDDDDHDDDDDDDDGLLVEGKLIRFDGDTNQYEIQLLSSDDATTKTTTTNTNNTTNIIKLTPSQMEWGVKMYNSIGKKVAKYFGDDLYEGQITNGYEPGSLSDDKNHSGLFRIEYDDGDLEDMNPTELSEALDLYQKQHKKKKTMTKKKRKTTTTTSTTVSSVNITTTKRGRKVKAAVYDLVDSNDDDEDDDDDDGFEEGEEKQPRKRSKVAASSSTKKKKKKKNDDDSDFEDTMVIDDESDDEEMEFDDDDDNNQPMADDDDDDFLSDDDGEDEKPKNKKKRKQPNGSSSKKKPASSSSAKPPPKRKSKPEGTQDELAGIVANTKFDPQNTPQGLLDFGTYVEPVGVDPTHGIVEGIIAGFVRKIGGLLLQATENNTEPNPFGLSFPLKLQTACSGTDAPSIALSLVQESLDKLFKANNSKSEENHGFVYDHVMSCEIEPFKQAYIGRNFPGVLLFPDICKLTTSEKVLDVYGRPKSIPDGNLFVAGTSCKDFSMLKTTWRLDIEDKGTSGETFLAAVEFLDQKQPPVAIFENVDGAPWAKMQEYITGRIDLSQRNEKRGIKEAKKIGKAEDSLKFSINDGRYVADVVPRHVGIRAGDVVEGFVKQGAKNTQKLVCDDKNSNKLITLKELAKKHKIDLESDTLVMEKKTRYCTQLIKLDTKQYGLPQTRQRKYLFIWRTDDPDDDLGDYFMEIMEDLKTPLLHSLEAFLLPDSHDRIRCFREALRSGRGRLVKRERAKELDFWNWEESRVKDLVNHLVFRKAYGIDELSRYITGWQPHGILKVAPGLWPELVDMWNHRRLDMIDCFAIASFRDSIPRDCLHHAYTWDLSQNVTRAPYRTATVGVSACVTPGGELIIPHKGRTVMGREKLSLQGIPYDRQDFGILSEVQQSDLAGNAMSVPVVCATMLAAICAPELRRARKANRFAKLSDYRLSQKYDEAGGAVLAERGDLYNSKRQAQAPTFMEAFKPVAESLAVDAFRSSVLCTCESSGTCTDDDKILVCTDCGMGVCGSCFDKYRMEPHNTVEIAVAGDDGRPDPNEFERKLRCAVPSILRLGEGWQDELKDGAGLESYSFQLLAVLRQKRKWTLTYGAWEDHGSGRQVAEIRVDIGKLGACDLDYGLAAFVRCFAPAIRHKNPYRGKLRDAARLIFKLGDKKKPSWEFPGSSTKSSLEIVGSERTKSQRVLAGLNDDAEKGIRTATVRNSKVPKIESRNNLLKYHKEWKSFPGKIQISGDSNDRVNGTYNRQHCEQTIVHSALWRRDAGENSPALYIYIRPDVVRAALDVAVIALTPQYEDGMEICELSDWIPENALVEKTHSTKVLFLNWKPAPDTLQIEVPTPAIDMKTLTQPFHDSLSSASEEDASNQTLCEMTGLSPDVIQVLLEHNAERKNDLDLYGKFGTRNSRRLSTVAAPTLLKKAAEGKLPLELSKWYKLPYSAAIGTSEVYVPSRPHPIWQKKSGRKGDVYERVYDEEESIAYYQRLSGRPPPFRCAANREGGNVKLFMNPYVAAHQAAAPLVGGEGGAPEVDYCLSELSCMGEPDTKVFAVPNSDSYKETSVDSLVLPLYKRQAKALTRMLAIENGDVSFSEEERSEHVLPGIGWCMIARAAKKSPLRGGVLGDAIGSGKTVVTIALILVGAARARANRNVNEGRSSATLIVVPPGLVQQWDDERKKFTKGQLKCIIIDSTATLKSKTVEDLCSADIVIVPAGIIEEAPKGKSRPYTEHLSKKAGAGTIPPAPTGYSQREAPTIEGTWIRNMASGPDIYVGNRGDQRKRDAQAYYGHCYSEAIAKLRNKSFGPREKGVPIEYFTWERIVIDECHETLVTGKKFETAAVDFKEKARRGAREFLGVAQTDVSKRPLLAARGVWGLTGTPLLETEARVTELANLMGGTYLTGASQHWRKEERESGRDLFLNQAVPTQSREYRCAVQESCNAYVQEACQRNRGEKLLVKLNRKRVEVKMSEAEGEAFLTVAAKAQLDSFAITPEQLGEKVADALTITASSNARHDALLKAIDEIQESEPETKIIIFANTSYGGYDNALKALKSGNKQHCHISDSIHTVSEQNEILSWFRHVDLTEEAKARPRILLLSFEQAAGHNLQSACHNVIMFDPYYSGPDAVADASVEEQAIGRVMRIGQNYDVTCTRIVVNGPNDEICLDNWIVDRNLDEDVLAAATSNFD